MLFAQLAVANKLGGPLTSARCVGEVLQLGTGANCYDPCHVSSKLIVKLKFQITRIPFSKCVITENLSAHSAANHAVPPA